MHALLLGAGGHPHGDILDGAAEARSHVSLEVGEDHETIGLPDDRGDLNGGKMAEPRRDLFHISAVHAVSDPDGTAEVLLREAVLCGRFQTVGRGAPPPGIEDGRIENERFDARFTKPPDDLARVAWGEKTGVSPLPPVDLNSHRFAGKGFRDHAIAGRAT